MRSVIVVGCVLVSLLSKGQHFVDVTSVNLPDSAAKAQVQWVELNGNVWLDVFVWAETPSGENFFITYESNPETGPKNPVAHYTGFRSATYRMVDFDYDNDMDVIVSGMFSNIPRTSFFENQSDFKFVVKTSLAVAASVIHFADLTKNGTPELVLSGSDNTGPFLKIYQFGTTWKPAHDSLKIHATSIEIFDFDKDGDNDIFLSGKENAVNTTKALINEGALYFKSSPLRLTANGKTSVGDLNHDGNLDVFLTGVDASNQTVSLQYVNTGNSFLAKDTLPHLSWGKPFLADFNSDGKCDIQLFGKTASGDTLNAIVFRDSATAYLTQSKLHDQTFGDYDRDGDLDRLQLLSGASLLRLQVSRNNFAPLNEGPKMAKGAFGFVIFNKLFLHWGKGQDDHTPENSITYDVTLHVENEDLLVGEFDLLNRKRFTVSHGNAGTRNYFILKPVKVSPFTYSVQGIDNSFETRSDSGGGPPGICSGTGAPCESQTLTELAACKDETLHFSAEFGAQWFSLSKGFLAEGTTYDMKVVASDTIFSFAADQGCPSLRVWLIHEKENLLRKTAETKFVCEGQSIPFTVESDWAKIVWKSYKQGEFGTSSSITFTTALPDTVTLTATNNAGCGIQHKTEISISKPVLQIGAETLQILKGQSVQLFASGADTYEWIPAESLDDATIANPIASPLSTTNYTVTATDSIGCAASATVKVLVEGDAFIPNLFTPNDDGRNDEVKVYGLSSVSNFSLVIHNREGNVLYETKDVGQASASGWDGTSKGVKQPAGVYYWKVKGQYPGGGKLLLNGKTTGSIVLIR